MNDLEINNKNVCVYILTHNRPQCILECVESVLNQTFENYIVCVSDNSDNDETERILSSLVEMHENLLYVHHKNLFSSYDHLMYIKNINTYEYYMLFHDDDQMMPRMVETLYSYLSISDNIAAIGSNAVLRIEGKTTSIRFNKNNENLICGGNELIECYSKDRFPPFPSYMYKKSKTDGIKPLQEHGWKYCDVSYIVDIAFNGNVFILSDVLMFYNISSLQDSKSFDLLSHIKLTNYLIRLSNRESVQGLRLYHIYVGSINGCNYGTMVFRRRVLSLFLGNCKFYYSFQYLAHYIKSMLCSLKNSVNCF